MPKSEKRATYQDLRPKWGRADFPIRLGNEPRKNVYDVIAAVVLYLLALIVFFKVVESANTLGILTGEEASVSFADVAAIGQRFQFTHYSTNFGGHVFYWIASAIDPNFGLFYGRAAKAVALALYAPLIFFVLRRRLGVRYSSAALGALAAVLLPGIISFSWLATENGLEAIAGLGGLLIATSRRNIWWIAPVFCGIAISVYGGGIPWAISIAIVVIVRLIRTRPWKFRSVLLVAASGAVGLGIIVFPLYWWQGGVIVVGGGSASSVGAIDAVRSLAKENLLGGDSYYYFNSQAALGSVALTVAAIAGTIWALIRRPNIWPWVLVALLTVLVYAFSGGVLGARRTMAIPLVVSIGIGFLVDRLGSLVRRVNKPAYIAALVVAAFLVLTPLVAQAQSNRAALATGRVALPLDFPLPLDPESTMTQTIDSIAERVRAGESWDQIATTYEGTRTSAIIYLLSVHAAIDPVPVSGETVKRLYEQSPRCEMNCRPVSGQI